MTIERAKQIAKQWADGHVCSLREGEMEEYHKMCLSALQNQQEKSFGGWISVEDRLPETQADVLVVAFWHECWQTMICWFSAIERKWRIITPHGEKAPGGVTHWMPLPEPPKEE